MRRRSSLVLPRADPRRRHLQPLLLVPRGPADVRGPVRIRAVGDASRSRHAADPDRLVEDTPPVRPRKTRIVRRRGGVVLSVKRILRDYEDAGSVNSLISLWGFVDDAAFLTKAGHVGIAYRLRGIDYEGLTHAQSAAIVHRLEAALRLLDEHWHLYQYVVKRTIPPVSAATCSQPVANEAIQERASYLNGRRSELFEVRLFVVLLYEPPTSARTSTSVRALWKSPLAGLRNWLSPAHTLRLL